MEAVNLLLLSLFFSSHVTGKELKKLVYLTVASDETDGYYRFLHSAHVNGIEPKVLGLGMTWLGGDMDQPGGGYKVNLLKEELRHWKDDEDTVVLFSDCYDVIVTGGVDELLHKFSSMDADIVFGAEDFCWPDVSLKDSYPPTLLGYQYLNSGGFMGYASTLFNLLEREEIGNEDDDQLFYTKLFLNDKVRSVFNIKLDNQAKIFQNLNGNLEDVALEFQDEDTRLINTVYKTTPIIIHGNGPSKVNLNSLGNYLAKSWVQDKGCLTCNEGKIDLSRKQEKEYPKVLLGLFVPTPTPFLEEMLAKVSNLAYPKSRIYLFVYNYVLSQEDILKKWTEEMKSRGYFGLKFISSKDNIKNWSARNLAIEKCLSIACDVYFNVDSEVHLDDPKSLAMLISYNRSVLAPVMTRVGKLWSTFWGAVTPDGFYARSADYTEIVNNQRTGIWNVPFIFGAYVIWSSVLANPKTRPNYIYKLQDADVAMATNFRRQNVFMYAVNLHQNFGHLVNNDVVTTEHRHNDLWQVAANPLDWIVRYLHPLYYEVLNSRANPQMPCSEVFWFPLFTERFCEEIIETMEDFGQWSGGKNEDPRLAGGYENVPTDDIHMNQVGYEQEWLFILKTYVKPIADKVFLGYSSDARSIMNFVVKYEPSRQFFLRPHHDSSTYTINVGLNRPGVDYEGGGAHFIRQNCSVTATKVGWTLMHPGRLTHFHEGLPTVSGTRYILVSFVDP